MSYKKKHNLKPWVKVLVWMIIIFAGSSIPGNDMPDIKIFEFDKVFHIVEYLVLAFLLLRAFGSSFSNNRFMKTATLVIIIAAFYAVFDELHQEFVPGRTPDVFDFTADLIGAYLGVMLYNARRKACRKSCHSKR